MLIRRSIVAWSLIVVALMCAASETFAAIQMPVEPPPTNKYKQRSKIDSSGVQISRDLSNITAAQETCHFTDIDVQWNVKLGSHIYSTPIITDFDGDGRKEVITASMHYIDVVHADDGTRSFGWPFGLSQTTFVADPVLYDLDGDGQDEIVACTQDGYILFITRHGQSLNEAILKVPKLKVDKDWFRGLDFQDVEAHVDLGEQHKEGTAANEASDPVILKSKKPKVTQHKTPSQLEEEETGRDAGTAHQTWRNFEGWLDEAGVKSLELFLPPKFLSEYEEETILRSAHQQDEEQSPDSNTLLVDSHILATPVFADLDKDGVDELVIVASYYFDDVVALDMTRLSQMPVDVNLRNYVASGVTVFDMKTMKIKWFTPFELTMEKSTHKGYAYAPPTVIDLNGDGKLNVIVGTAFGSIYVMDHNGLPARGVRPMSMDAIYASVIAEDIDGDGKVELIAIDAGANVVCYNHRGEEVWENRIAGVAHSAPVVGDVDGDGVFDVVIATDAGMIFALNGNDGKFLKNFPMKVAGPIMASPVLIPPASGKLSDGLGIAVTSTDGHIYVAHSHGPNAIINNKPGEKISDVGCVEKIDMGEGSHSSLIIDDLDQDGRLCFVLATSAGHVYALTTNFQVGSFGHLASWTSPMHGRNVHKSLVYEGVRFTDETRNRILINGREFDVTFDLVFDQEKAVKAVFKNQTWRVRFLLGRNVLAETTYFSPGRYTMRLPSPGTRWLTGLTIEAVNSHGHAFFDRMHVEFNTNFGQMLGWMLFLPFMVAMSMLLLVKDVKALLPA